MYRREFSLDLARPLTTARGTVRQRSGILVGIGEDDVLGVGEATPLPPWTESLSDCRAALDTLASVDGVDTTLHSLAAGDDAPLSTAADAIADPLVDAPAARHAVELAVLDARGRRRERPLAGLLTADPSSTVPVNATIGDGPVDETVSAAVDAVSAGFDCLKVKVGAAELDRDVTRLRAVRDAVGDAELRADANGSWDRETAADAIDALAALDLAYVEQPLPADDLSGHAALRGRGVPIALDETLAVTPPATVLDADAADVLVLKPMALGGPWQAYSAARNALAAGVDPVVTTTVDAAPARTAAVHVAAAIPDIAACGLATGDALATDVAPDPAPVEAGSVAVPSAPGLAGDAFDSLFD